MYYFYPESNGRIKALYQPKDGNPLKGAYAVEAIPEIPTAPEGYTPALYMKGNELVWRLEELPPEPELETESEPEA